MYEKTIICLANSRKPPSGRCIAGKEFSDDSVGGWVRPVSSRPGHEVSEEERKYKGGRRAQLLDIVTVPLLKPSPVLHQVENHILAAEYYWEKIGVASWDQVLDCVDEHDAAFWAHSEKTYHGVNDKVAAPNVNKIGSSLKLILVNDLELRVRSEDGYEGNPARRRVRANFSIGHNTYRLSVTDPEIDEEFLIKGDGDYELGEAALCISLVEVWNGFAFRVVASVITPARCDL
jgi:hypothetical protein